MAKVWRVFAHPDYLSSFRRVVADPADRFKVTIGIREYLKRVDDPSEDLKTVPGESDQYEFDVLGYTIIAQWNAESSSDIRLLEVYATAED